MRRATLLGLLASGCWAFPDPPRDTCGNLIVEANEDCDGDDDERCRACHLVCDPGSSDDGCPADRICGSDGLCRAPSGFFETEPLRIAHDGARWLDAADLDADRKDELVVQLDHAVVEAIHVGMTIESLALAHGLGRAGLGDLDGDRRAELLLAQVDDDGTALGVSLVREGVGTDGQRIAQPAVLPTLRTEDALARLLAPAPVRDRVLELVGPDVTRGWSSGAPDSIALDPPLPIDALPLGTAIAVAQLHDLEDVCTDASGDFPRPEVALASQGASRVRVVSTCGGTASFELAFLPDVALADGETLGDAGTFFADANADLRPDLVTQTAAGAIVVAYGVGDGSFHGDAIVPAQDGDGRFAAAPLVAGDAGELLAVGDVDGDAALELVTSIAFIDAPEGCGLDCAAAWEETMSAAVLVDLDDDGTTDVVGVHDEDLAIRLGELEDGALALTPKHDVELDGPGTALAIGDFNRDTVADVALLEEGEHERALVLYGGAIVDWRVESFGPFADAQALAIDGQDTLVVRTLDDAQRSAGAFVRPGEIVADFGFAVGPPVIVRAGERRVAAAVVAPADATAARLAHFGFVDGALSPHDVELGDTLVGLAAEDAAQALVVAVDLDRTAPITDELVVLATTGEDGTVWVARLDPDAGSWSIVERFAGVGPGFARRVLVGDVDGPAPSGGPGSAIAIGDVDGDGDDDVLATTDETLPVVVVLTSDHGVLSEQPPTFLLDSKHLSYEIAQLVPWHDDATGRPQWLVAGDDGVGLASIDLDAGDIEIHERSTAHTTALTAADVDGDGLRDLVLATDTEIRIHRALEGIGRD